MIADFNASQKDAGVFGLKVLARADEGTVIGLDPARGRWFVDRTRSGKTDFHAGFAGMYEAPLSMRNGKVRLHIFVDACSVEVFAENGETALTSLVFPSAASRGVEFFGPGESTSIRSLEVWTLKSCWK